MVAVRIPGAAAIDNVAPARDPGVQATPDEFGAGIGASGEKFGSVLGSIGALLNEKRQDAQDQVYAQTYRLQAEPALTQASIDAKKAFPDGGPGFLDDLKQRTQAVHESVTSNLASQGLTPSPKAQQHVGTTFAGLQTNALVNGVVYENNARVTKLKTLTVQNTDTISSQVLSGALSVDDGLKQVDGITSSSGALFTGGELEKFKQQARDKVIDASIQSAIASKDTEKARELNNRFYGAVPQPGQSAVATAMDYFQSTGLSKEQAAGIVGNLNHESGFNTSASGDNGTAFGIAQWRGERLDALKAYATSKGKPATDLQTQLEFVNKELNSTEGSARNKLLAATTTKDAATAFIDFERPQGFGTSNPHGLANRLRLAESAAGGSGEPGERPNVSKALTFNTQINSMDGVNRADMKSTVADDLASMQTTGQGIPDLSPDRVAKALGPNAADDWQTARARAKTFYDTTQDFYALPDTEINARLTALAPKPGQEEFVAQQDLYTAAVKKAETIRAARQTDPVGSVAQDPQVKQASQGAKMDDPASFQPLVTARLAAQDRAGIPPDAQSPISKQEAMDLTVPLRRMLPGQERSTLMEMGKKFQTLFGENADSAFAYALRVHKVDAATAQAAARVVKKLGLGELPEPADTQAADQSAELSSAEKATGAPSFGMAANTVEGFGMGPMGQPNSVAQPEGANIPLRAIKDLRRDPRLAGDFDAKYGKGSSQKILDNYPIR